MNGGIVYKLTEAEQATVTMLHGRRSQVGSRVTEAQTAAEVALMGHYGRQIGPGDVGRGMALSVVDVSGRSISVIHYDVWPFNVFTQALGKDVYVFAHTWPNYVVELFGWLPGSQVEQAPIEWFLRNAVRTNYAHRIENEDHLAVFPDTLDFVACPHFDQFGGLWNPLREAWECFGCERLVYSEASRERFARL